MLRKTIHWPSTCDLLRRMSAQATGPDGRIVNKQTNSKCSPHTERFGNGNNEIYSPNYFILHLKKKGSYTGWKRLNSTGNPGCPLPGSQATHSLTPGLGPYVTCPKSTVSWLCVPGPCPEMPLKHQRLNALKEAQALAKQQPATPE